MEGGVERQPGLAPHRPHPPPLTCAPKGHGNYVVTVAVPSSSEIATSIE